jgi:predicted  nucleic acid-binding Zn-ribbon protein
MEARRVQLDVQAGELRAVIAAEEAKIDEEIRGLVAQRLVLDPPVPGAVLTLYEKMRGFPRLGGLVAVSTAGGTCAGCKTVLPILLTSRLARGPVDDVVQCVNCLRILVA